MKRDIIRNSLSGAGSRGTSGLLIGVGSTESCPLLDGLRYRPMDTPDDVKLRRATQNVAESSVDSGQNAARLIVYTTQKFTHAAGSET